MVCRAIATGDATAIEAEFHIEVLNADIVNQLIEPSL